MLKGISSQGFAWVKVQNHAPQLWLLKQLRRFLAGKPLSTALASFRKVPPQRSDLDSEHGDYAGEPLSVTAFDIGIEPDAVAPSPTYDPCLFPGLLHCRLCGGGSGFRPSFRQDPTPCSATGDQKHLGFVVNHAIAECAELGAHIPLLG